MSLRDGVLPSKQSPVSRGDCFAKYARNDTQTAALRELQSATGGNSRRRCWDRHQKDTVRNNGETGTRPIYPPGNFG
jgi:hypothetical protein